MDRDGRPWHSQRRLAILLAQARELLPLLAIRRTTPAFCVATPEKRPHSIVPVHVHAGRRGSWDVGGRARDAEASATSCSGTGIAPDCRGRTGRDADATHLDIESGWTVM